MKEIATASIQTQLGVVAYQGAGRKVMVPVTGWDVCVIIVLEWTQCFQPYLRESGVMSVMFASRSL